MVNKSDELYTRSRYVSVLIDALLSAHPDWKVERRYETQGIVNFQYIIFSVGEKHSSVAIDVRSDTLESIRRRFHFLEADFLWYLDKTNGISLTTLPDYTKIDLMGPEPAPEKEIGWAATVAIVVGILVLGACIIKGVVWNL